MDLFTFGGEDNTGACASSGDRADSGSFFATRNGADDRANAGAACDDFRVTRRRGALPLQ